jgi:hypothetical protein
MPELFIHRKSISLPVPLAFSGCASASATLPGGLMNLLFSRFSIEAPLYLAGRLALVSSLVNNNLSLSPINVNPFL